MSKIVALLLNSRNFPNLREDYLHGVTARQRQLMNRRLAWHLSHQSRCVAFNTGARSILQRTMLVRPLSYVRSLGSDCQFMGLYRGRKEDTGSRCPVGTRSPGIYASDPSSGRSLYLNSRIATRVASLNDGTSPKLICSEAFQSSGIWGKHLDPLLFGCNSTGIVVIVKSRELSKSSMQQSSMASRR